MGSDSAGIIEQDGGARPPGVARPRQAAGGAARSCLYFRHLCADPDHIAFAARDQVLVDLAAKHAICFGKPFVDAPGPNQAAISKSAVALTLRLDCHSVIRLAALVSYLTGPATLCTSASSGQHSTSGPLLVLVRSITSCAALHTSTRSSPILE